MIRLAFHVLRRVYNEGEKKKKERSGEEKRKKRESKVREAERRIPST